MKKIVLLLSAAFVFALVSCQSSNDASTNTDSASSDSVQTVVADTNVSLVADTTALDTIVKK